jgi:hypothetical protein
MRNVGLIVITPPLSWPIGTGCGAFRIRLCPITFLRSWQGIENAVSLWWSAPLAPASHRFYRRSIDSTRRAFAKVSADQPDEKLKGCGRTGCWESVTDSSENARHTRLIRAIHA